MSQARCRRTCRINAIGSTRELLFERMKQAARTCARDSGEHFDGERLVPTRLDVFLGSLDLPRSRPSRTAIEKMAIIVAVADEEPRHQGLLDLDQRNKGHVSAI